MKPYKPNQWSFLNIVPIPKYGDLGDAVNYRGINLSSIVATRFTLKHRRTGGAEELNQR